MCWKKSMCRHVLASVPCIAPQEPLITALNLNRAPETRTPREVHVQIQPALLDVEVRLGHLPRLTVAQEPLRILLVLEPDGDVGGEPHDDHIGRPCAEARRPAPRSSESSEPRHGRARAAVEGAATVRDRTDLALSLGPRDLGYARVSSSTGMVRTPAVWRA